MNGGEDVAGHMDRSQVGAGYPLSTLELLPQRAAHYETAAVHGCPPGVERVGVCLPRYLLSGYECEGSVLDSMPTFTVGRVATQVNISSWKSTWAVCPSARSPRSIFMAIAFSI